MDQTIVVAIIAGSVGIAVAVIGLLATIVGLVPNLGRMRRLERIVAILKDTDDAEGRAKLIAVRDGLIAKYEPGPEYLRAISRGGFTVCAGYVVIVAGLFVLGFRESLPASVGLVFGNILVTVGVVAAFIGLAFFIGGVAEGIYTLWAERKTQRENAAKAAEAVVVAERAAKSPWWIKRKPAPSPPSPGTTSTRPARSARRRR